MASVFAKLNLKDQKEVVILNAPASFEREIETLHGVSVVRDPGNASAIQFALAFAVTQAELDRSSKLLVAKGKGDVVLWIAYPKKTSTRYTCEFNRDSGWDVLRAAGFDTVRQVAIDDDWSALRFRRVEYIKSAPGKRRALNR
jgi:hypothetical protein